MKYLLINSVAGIGSTGKIAADICRKLICEGHQAVLAYGRDKANCDDIETVKIGNKLDVYWHVAMTRLFDKHGLCSKHATNKFLQWVDNYNPDVIWLHNIHGYYINYEALFSYIKKKNIKTKWTLHDCWSFTGHCSYFTFVKCEQWQSHCSYCPQADAYPQTIFKKNVSRNFERKQNAFTNVSDLELVVPSKWLKNLVRQSFLKDYSCSVIYNEIDKSIFKPTQSDFREKFHLEDKKIILGVASIWSERKGLNDFYKLAKMLDDKYVIVLVGLSDKQLKELPDKILGFKKTNSLDTLAGIYSTIDVFVNQCNGETLEMDITDDETCDSFISYEKAPYEVNAENSSGIVVSQSAESIYKVITGKDYLSSVYHNGVYKIITFKKTNNQRELAELYSSSDYFVNPTYEDNYPTVNLEAIACGCFVITYDTGGSKETLELI